MAYKGRVGGGIYMARQSRNRIAGVWVMRMGGGNKGMVDSCTGLPDVNPNRKTSDRISCIGQPSEQWDLRAALAHHIIIQGKRRRTDNIKQSHRLGLPMVVCVECLPADKPWEVVSVTRRSSGVAPRACVRVYARVLVPPNLYIHTYINSWG